MKKIRVLCLNCLVFLMLPMMLSAQGNPTRGVGSFRGSVTFNNVIGAFTSSHSAVTITSSKNLEDYPLEYLVFTKKSAKSEWALTESGTIQQAGYDLNLCYSDAKSVMVILSCKQKDGGTVSFSSKKCKK